MMRMSKGSFAVLLNMFEDIVVPPVDVSFSECNDVDIECFHLF